MELRGVAAGYGKNIIVDGVTIDIKKGEIISLIGPNGGGKSTLLKSIQGQLRLLGGVVCYDGRSIEDIPLKELSKMVSVLTTDRVRPELMSCRDVVESGRIPYTDGFGRLADEDRKIAGRAIALMKAEGFADKPFGALSDGQKQRCLIARAICQEPQYLIMDEPTSYLDIRYRLELMDVIRGLAGKGVTIIMSLHELELALSVSDRLIMIGEGKEVQIRRPEEIIQKKLIRDLYNMTDEMYERVAAQFDVREDDSDGGRHSTFFLNKKCEHYPCHDLAEDRFSCMFCYCPLYAYDDCGGNYTFTDKGIKNCRQCSFVHDRGNYGAVIKRLKERMYEKD